MVKVQIPAISGVLFTSKFSVNSRNFHYIFKNKKIKHYKEFAPGGGPSQQHTMLNRVYVHGAHMGLHFIDLSKGH